MSNEGRATNDYRCKITGFDGKTIYTNTVSVNIIKRDEFETGVIK